MRKENIERGDYKKKDSREKFERKSGRHKTKRRGLRI